MSLIAELRSATAALHHRVEQTPASIAIVSPKLRLPEYTAYLKRLLALHLPVEELVFPTAGQIVEDIELRKKSQWITQDLQALQEHIFLDDTDPFLDASFRNNLPFCLGIMYVSEGSTLGGQVILKNVLLALGDSIAQAHTFFRAYGEHTGSYWKNFVATLEKYGAGASRAECSEAVEGALYAFERTAMLFKQPTQLIQ